jgi:hypothetical protein
VQCPSSLHQSALCSCAAFAPHWSPAQALADAAETQCAVSKKMMTHSHEDASVDRAASSCLRLRQLFCLSHCLLGRIVEWSSASEAMKLYDRSVRVLPCGESLLQQGRLALKMATTQKQLEIAQQACLRQSVSHSRDALNTAPGACICRIVRGCR